MAGHEQCYFGEQKNSSFDDFKDRILESSQELEGELRNNIIDSESEFQRFSLLIDSEISSLGCDDTRKEELRNIALQASTKFEGYSFQIRSHNIFAAIHGALEISQMGEIPRDESIMDFLGIPKYFIFQRIKNLEESSIFGREGEIRFYFSSPDEIVNYVIEISPEGEMLLSVSKGLQRRSFINFPSNIDPDTRIWEDIQKYITLDDIKNPTTYEIGYGSPNPEATRNSINKLLGELPSQPRSRDEREQALIEFKAWIENDILVGELDPNAFLIVLNRLLDIQDSGGLVGEFLSSADPSLLHYVLDSTDNKRILSQLFDISKKIDPILERAVREKIQPYLEEIFPFAFDSASYNALPLDERDSILEFVAQGGITEEDFDEFVDYFYSTFFINTSNTVKRDVGWKLYNLKRNKNPLTFFREYADFSLRDGEYIAQGEETRRFFSKFSADEFNLSRDQARSLAEKTMENYVDEIHNIPYIVKKIIFHFKDNGITPTYSQWQHIIDSIQKSWLNSEVDESLKREIAYRYEYNFDGTEISVQDTSNFFEKLGRLIEIHSSLFPDGAGRDKNLGRFLDPYEGNKLELSTDSITRLIYRWEKLPPEIATNPDAMSNFMFRFIDVNKAELDTIASMNIVQLRFLNDILANLTRDADVFETPEDATEFLSQIEKIEGNVHAMFIFADWYGTENLGRTSHGVGYSITVFEKMNGYWSELDFPYYIRAYDLRDEASILRYYYIRSDRVTPEMIVKYQELILGGNSFINELAHTLIEVEGLNPEEILQKLSECEGCKNLGRRSTKQALLKYTKSTRNLDGLLELVPKLEQFENNQSDTSRLLGIMLRIIPRAELGEYIDLLLDPNLEKELFEIHKEFSQEIWNNGRDIVTRYIGPEDLHNPQELRRKLEGILRSIRETGYTSDIDPTREKMDALFYGFESTLYEENTDIFVISYILNSLVGKTFEIDGVEQELTPGKLGEIAFKFFHEGNSETLQKKGAMLLIGLGTPTSQFSFADIRRLTKVSVDKNLTKFSISKDITQEQLDFIRDNNIPLSLYFSILSTLREEGDDGDFGAFREKIETYEILRDEPIFIGQTIALYHAEGDSIHSNIGGDNWETGFYGDISESLGVSFHSIHHGEGAETKDSIFAYLENETRLGPITILVGGHGNDDIISFGRESFNIQEFFESLKKRQQNMGGNGEVRIIFSSCYSETNLKRLFELWRSDDLMKDIPLSIVSSSSERASSYKMAKDAWRNYSSQVASGNFQGTWNDFYSQVESRNYILTRPRAFFGWDNVNSNMSLWIDGEKLG